LQDFLSWDRPKVQDDAAGVYSGRFEGLAPTNQLANDAASNVRPDDTNINNSIYESQYLFVGNSMGATAQTQTPVIHVKFQLDKIPHSIFSINKNLAFNENMYINIYWNALSQIMFTAATGASPANGGAVAQASIVTGTRVQNLSLWLAVDKNIETQAIVRQKIASRDMNIIVPWVFQQIIPVTQGSNQSP
jgi:hypothetical protein